MSSERARHAAVPSYHRAPTRTALGSARALTVACALAIAASPAAAKVKSTAAHQDKPADTEHVSKEPFGKIPKGPLQIVISIDQQELHLYSDGAHVADTLVATGVPEHPTPMGVFDVIQKSRFHRSNIYSNAPMPYMQRITWSGVAIHEGVNLGHPASHGCIRMSHEFATRLWVLTRLGAQVIIVRPELRPEEFADRHLFVHTEKPPAPTASAAKPVMTAQTAETSKTTDMPPPADPPGTVANTTGSNAAAAGGLAKLDPASAKTPTVAEPNAPAPAASSAAPAADPEAAPPPPKTFELAHPASKAPIAILISRKDKKIYVRQDFSPLFDAPITIEQAGQRLGTHVFTALEYLPDRSGLRWNVISLPGEQPKPAQKPDIDKNSAKSHHKDEHAAKRLPDPPPPQSPQQALDRIEIPQDVIEQISQLIVPGSSLIVSDQGLGEETGEDTDFIVITH